MRVKLFVLLSYESFGEWKGQRLVVAWKGAVLWVALVNALCGHHEMVLIAWTTNFISSTNKFKLNEPNINVSLLLNWKFIVDHKSPDNSFGAWISRRLIFINVMKAFPTHGSDRCRKYCLSSLLTWHRSACMWHRTSRSDKRHPWAAANWLAPRSDWWKSL